MTDHPGEKPVEGGTPDVWAPPSGGASQGWGAEPRAPEHYRLKLYVSGMSERGQRAVEAITAVCEEYLQGHYDLEVIDIVRHPECCAPEQIVAAPTLVKQTPLPLRRLVGDLSRTDRVLAGLGLPPSQDDGPVKP